MIKKLIIILGVILISISQGRYMLSDYLNEILLRNIDFPNENYLLTIPLLFLMELIGGFLYMLGNVWKFILSWEGVLLIAVILLHLNFRKYMKSLNLD